MKMLNFTFLVAMSIASAIAVSCKEQPVAKQEKTLESQALDYWNWYHQISEMVYDGDGEWGRDYYGYRDVIRNSYWRGESYLRMASTNHTEATAYEQRNLEAVNYLLVAQAQGGTGVYGVPNEINHPEFGSVIRAVNQEYPSGINNGWISDLPQPKLPELYYDHGYALTYLSRVYNQTKDQSLLTPINTAATWILNHDQTSENDNYHSAVAKGLSFAYAATGNAAYLEKAVDIHEKLILPNQQTDGKWDDKHNQKLVYHSFICSGMLALRKVLPKTHASSATLDIALDKAMEAFLNEINGIQLQEFNGKVEGWPGSCLITLVELSEMRPLSPEEAEAMDKVVSYLISNRSYIEDNISSNEASILLRLSAPIGMYVASIVD